MVSVHLPPALLLRPTKDSHLKRPPKWLYQRSSRWFTIFVVSFSIFTDLFLYSLIVPVLPFALSERANVPSQDVQHWVSVLLTVYGVSLVVGSPFVGYLSDRMPTRSPSFLGGLVVLLGSTLMFCFARSIALLLLARILQGFSAAVVWAVSLSILADRVGAKGTGYAIGWTSVGRTLSVVLGPVLGGVVYAEAGYYAVFGMAFACLAVDIGLRLVLIEARIARKWDPKIGPDDLDESETELPEDLENGGNEISSNTPAHLSTTTESRKQDDRFPSQSDACRSRQGRSQSRRRNVLRRLPPAIILLLIPRFLLAFWGCIFEGIIITGLDAVLPLFVSRTFQWTSSGAGLLFLAFVIPSFMTPITGWLSDRHGPKWYAVLGYLLLVAPLVLLRLIVHNTLEQKVFLGVLLTWMGVAGACYEIPFWVEIATIAETKGSEDPELFGDKGAIGQAYGLGTMGWALGAVIGPIWAGFVYSSAGWDTMGWSLALLSVASAVPTAIWTGGYLFGRKDKRVGTAEKTKSAPAQSSDQEGSVSAPAERAGLNAREENPGTNEKGLPKIST